MIRRILLLVGGFLLPALLVYAPALSTFATTIPGDGTAQRDGWQNVWNLWWTAFALRQGMNPLATTWLYYPDGISLFWQTLNVTNGLLALPITLLAGPVAAYNTLALSSFVLTSLSAYLLVRTTGASRPAAFVAGLLLSFSPIHLARLADGQLEHLTIQWLPLYALLLMRVFDRAPEEVNAARALLAALRATLPATLLLLWITLTSLYQALSCLILTALYTAVLLALRPSWQAARRMALHSVLIGLLWMLPLTPILLGSLTGAASDDDWLDQQRLHSATPLDFVLPNPHHILWGEPISRFGQTLHPDAGSWTASLGLVAVGLALVGLRDPQIRRSPWPYLAAGCLLLALGPELRLGPTLTGIPLPYALLNLLPPARLGQRPNYLALFALLALLPVAARGLDLLLARVRRPMLVLACVGVLLLIDLAPAPLALTDSAVPAIFTELASDPQPGAVLELPFLPERSEPLQAQLVHQRPILGGFVSRTPYYPFPMERPALNALWTRRVPDELVRPDRIAATASTLRYYGIRFIVVRWRELAPNERVRQAEVLAALPQGTLQQRYDFQGLAVYEVSDYTEPAPFAFLRGAYPAEAENGRRWQWMGQSAELVVVNPLLTALPATIHLRAEAPGEPRELAILTSGSQPAPIPLTSLTIDPAPTIRQLQVLLPPGETTLLLRTRAAPSANDPRPLGVVFTRIEVR